MSGEYELKYNTYAFSYVGVGALRRGCMDKGVPSKEDVLA
jgi:hypothetical protein